MIMREQLHLAEPLCLVEGINVAHDFNLKRISREGNEVDGDNRAIAIAFSLLPSLPSVPNSTPLIQVSNGGNYSCIIPEQIRNEPARIHSVQMEKP
jgi:hypothetical protein